MKKLAILSPLVLLATTALAQDSTCILQPSCSQLGYTSAEADCGTAKVLRCPFDVSQVACLSGGSDGGSGAGGEPSDEFGTVDNSSCQVGYIYYSDDTCSPEYNYFKDPIGIVFDANRRYIISLIYGTYKWSTLSSYSGTEIPIIEKALSLVRDFDGKKYTDHLLENSSQYPAAQYCGTLTMGNKNWFLPSYGQLYLLSLKIGTVDSSLDKITHHTKEPLFKSKCFGIRSSSLTDTKHDYGLDACGNFHSQMELNSWGVSSSVTCCGSNTYFQATTRCIAEY